MYQTNHITWFYWYIFYEEKFKYAPIFLFSINKTLYFVTDGRDRKCKCDISSPKAYFYLKYSDETYQKIRGATRCFK